MVARLNLALAMNSVTISCYDRTLNMSWFYNERQHLKGPMDGLRGTEKNVISRDSKSESARSTHWKILQSTQIKEWIPSPLCIYQNVNQVPKAPKIPQTFPVHKVIRHMSKNFIVYLQFFYLACDEKLFFTQYHQKEGDPEISGQKGMDVKDECHSAKCREAENGSDWLCCPLCGICFHKDSFYI